MIGRKYNAASSSRTCSQRTTSHFPTLTGQCVYIYFDSPLELAAGVLRVRLSKAASIMHGHHPTQNFRSPIKLPWNDNIFEAPYMPFYANFGALETARRLNNKDYIIDKRAGPAKQIEVSGKKSI